MGEEGKRMVKEKERGINERGLGRIEKIGEVEKE
jgi:hypothetical protein